MTLSQAMYARAEGALWQVLIFAGLGFLLALIGM